MTHNSATWSNRNPTHAGTITHAVVMYYGSCTTGMHSWYCCVSLLMFSDRVATEESISRHNLLTICQLMYVLSELTVTGHFPAYFWTQSNLVGQICYTFSLGESLTICNNVSIFNKWPFNFNTYFQLNSTQKSYDFVVIECCLLVQQSAL